MVGLGIQLPEKLQRSGLRLLRLVGLGADDGLASGGAAQHVALTRLYPGKTLGKCLGYGQKAGEVPAFQASMWLFTGFFGLLSHELRHRFNDITTAVAVTMGAQGTDFLAGAFRVTPQEPGGAGGLDILPGELPIEHLNCINILLFNVSVSITCCTCRYESIIPV